MTMAAAIRVALTELGGHASREKIRDAVVAKYPGRWKPNTLTAHLYACLVNNPKAYLHHPSADRFLFKRDDGTFEFYSEAKHGPNQWEPKSGTPDGVPGSEAEAAQLIAASLSLERDVEEFIAANLDELEPGLTLKDRQLATDARRIDILASDRAGRPVIIELKVGTAGDSAVGQLARYLGWWKQTKGEAARGFIVAADIPRTVMYGASALDGVSLRRYRLHVSFEEPGFDGDEE
jgi:RecB family endonuclease NucS